MLRIVEFLDSFSEPLFLLSPDLKILWSNRAFREKLSPEKDFCYQLMHQRNEPPRGCPALKALNSQKTAWGIMKIEALGKELFVVVSPVVRGEEVIALWHLAFEVKMGRAAEDSYIFYETLGQLTAGLSHDIKNMLTAAMAELELLSLLTNDKPQLRRRCEKIMTILENVCQISKKLCDIGRGKRETRPLNINQVLKNITPLLKSLVPRHINLIINIDPYVREIYFDELALEQIILNLLLNAVQAIEGEGKITVSTFQEKDFAVLAIEDTGIGLKKELITKIFEPNFSTKEQHSGLGLALIKKWVEEADGKIRVTSIEGEGARFEVWLPTK